MARLIVDPDTCIGSGECVAEDPDVIEIDDSGIAHVLVAEMDEARAQRICDVCPVGALSVES
jgi:ferredoxin